MKKSTYLKTIFFLGLAGLLFSGYLSATKLFTSTCAFNEPCPYFWGHPACFYGFGMFLTIFVFATLGLLRKISEKSMSVVVAIVSFLGILFAGHFVIPEIINLLAGIHKTYTLVLPTCTYGLIFYITLFIFSACHIKQN